MRMKGEWLGCYGQWCHCIGLCSVLRPRQHSIGYMGDGSMVSKAADSSRRERHDNFCYPMALIYDNGSGVSSLHRFGGIGRVACSRLTGEDWEDHWLCGVFRVHVSFTAKFGNFLFHMLGALKSLGNNLTPFFSVLPKAKKPLWFGAISPKWWNQADKHI